MNRREQIEIVRDKVKKIDGLISELKEESKSVEEQGILYKDGDKVTAFLAQGRDEVKGVVLRGWFRKETYWYLVAYDNGTIPSGLMDKQIICEDDLTEGWKK